MFSAQRFLAKRVFSPKNGPVPGLCSSPGFSSRLTQRIQWYYGTVRKPRLPAKRHVCFSLPDAILLGDDTAPKEHTSPSPGNALGSGGGEKPLFRGVEAGEAEALPPPKTHGDSSDHAQRRGGSKLPPQTYRVCRSAVLEYYLSTLIGTSSAILPINAKVFPSTVSLTNRTPPSPMPKLAPPECSLPGDAK